MITLATAYADAIRPSKSVWSRRIRVQATAGVPRIRFLVTTSVHGVLLYDKRELTQILPGDCYGLTRHGDWWYVFQRLGNYGRITRFQLDGAKPRGVQRVLAGLNYGIHQIDFLDNRLVLIDTLKNRLLVYEGAAKLRRGSWQRWTLQVYPLGVRKFRDYRWDRAQSDQHPGSYPHFNSIFRRHQQVYIVAHNHTMTSGRRSQLFMLDDDLKLQEIRDLGAADVHNYWTSGHQELFCASAKGSLRNGSTDAILLGGYTRGLSVSHDYLLVGTSRLDPNRKLWKQHNKARRSWMPTQCKPGTGGVHFINREFKRLGHIIIPDTDVHDIRRIDAEELALSTSQESSTAQLAS